MHVRQGSRVKVPSVTGVSHVASWRVTQWLLKLHPEKCKVVHVGHSYQTKYTVEDSGSCSRILQQTEEEKDLGVHTTSDLKSSTQCNKAANKAMSVIPAPTINILVTYGALQVFILYCIVLYCIVLVLRMVNRAFRGMDKDDFLVLYKSFIRPHLEYCVQSWNPHFFKYEEVLEKVQKSTTKCVKGIKGKKYSERLHILGLTTLKIRRIRGWPYRNFQDLDGKRKCRSSETFQLADSSQHTRGHSLKLYKRHCRLNARKFFFSQRVVNSWNSLTQHVAYRGTICQLLQEAAGWLLPRWACSKADASMVHYDHLQVQVQVQVRLQWNYGMQHLSQVWHRSQPISIKSKDRLSLRLVACVISWESEPANWAFADKKQSNSLFTILSSLLYFGKHVNGNDSWCYRTLNIRMSLLSGYARVCRNTASD